MYGNPQSRPLFSVLGIPVSYSPWHFVLLAYIGYIFMRTEPVYGLGVVVLATLSLLGHELGHALVCRYYGLRPSIEMMYLGGLCHHAPARNEKEDFFIVAAGPGANFLMAGGFFALSFVLSGPGIPAQLVVAGLWWNIALGIYNLLPIYPLDGGILTLLIAKRIWRRGVKAERLVHRVGTGLAGLLTVYGLATQNWLVVIVMAQCAIANWTALQQVGASPVVHEAEPHSQVRELLEKARAAYASGDFEGAMRLCHQARAEPFLSIDEMQHVWQVLALSAARLSQWSDAARYAERVKGSGEMAQVQAVCVLALKDPQRARDFLSSRAAQLVSAAQLESIRVLARSASEIQA